MLKIDEDKLWMQVCKGNKKSFEILYRAHAKGLYQYALSFTSRIELIEDVIQDLFVRIYNNHENLNNDINVHAYLFKSFRNNLFRMLEKEKRYFYYDSNEYCFEITFSIEHEIMVTEDDLLRKQKLINGISHLTSKQKEIIYLRYTRGLDYEDISDILTMSIESCRNATYRAIKVLRKECNSTAMVMLCFFSKKS